MSESDSGYGFWFGCAFLLAIGLVFMSQLLSMVSRWIDAID